MAAAPDLGAATGVFVGLVLVAAGVTAGLTQTGAHEVVVALSAWCTALLALAVAFSVWGEV